MGYKICQLKYKDLYVIYMQSNKHNKNTCNNKIKFGTLIHNTGIIAFNWKWFPGIIEGSMCNKCRAVVKQNQKLLDPTDYNLIHAFLVPNYKMNWNQNALVQESMCNICRRASIVQCKITFLFCGYRWVLSPLPITQKKFFMERKPTYLRDKSEFLFSAKHILHGSKWGIACGKKVILLIKGVAFE